MKPITDSKMLVGIWKGTLSTRGASHDYTFTIKDDGTYGYLANVESKQD
jgi:hypothetical protein